MSTDTPTSLPLSSAQYGIWLGQQLDPASPAYWTAEALELAGPVDRARLETAIRHAIDDCEALHQRFEQSGDQVLQRHAQASWAMATLALSDAALADWLRADLAQPADLRHGPLFHTALIELGPERTLWYLRAHHVALDGYGHALLAQRVADLYASQAASLPPLRSGDLARVVTEDAAYRGGDACVRDRSFWQTYLADAPAPVLLAPARPVARAVRRVRGEIGGGSAPLFGELGANVIAAVAAWLQRETGAAELTLGLPVMNRLGSAALDVPCMAMNIVPLRLRVDDQASLRELAAQVAAELRAIRPRQRYRYEHIKEDLEAAYGRNGATRRLFGAVVNLMPFDRPLHFGAASARTRAIAAGPVEDLAIAIAPHQGRLRLDLDANPDAYDATRLAALHARLGAALAALAAQPDLPLRQVLGRAPLSWACGPALPHAPLPPPTVLDALRAQAARHPRHPAIEQDGLVLTYADLLDQVRALAGRLGAAGVGAQDRVALLLERRPDTIVAMLAVLWAGAGYVPLDPHGPPLRIAAVLADARPALIVTTRAHARAAPGAPQLILDQTDRADQAPPMAEPLSVDAHALAYVIYTSGSTGRPNGVMIGRAALAHFVAGASLRYAIGETDRVLQFAPLHFDASVEEIYLPLCAGATLVLRNDAMLESLPRFVAACAERRISVLDLPTAFWHELAYCLSQGQTSLPDSLRLVIIGGEAALAERIARWHASVAPGIKLLNTYGPTETTVIVTSAVLAPGAALSIGLPLPGTDVVLVDADLRPVPLGVEGELCVLGPALASGYLGQPELSARRFVSIEGRRAYRSGDRAVLDGELRFLGRLDHELKLSGQRIDPLEIEAALLDYPGLRETAVVAVGKRLHGFYCADGTPPHADALRAHLAERIMAAALPASYHHCARLPRNHNGKIDRAALRAMASEAHVPASDGASALELAVIAVWREVLGVSAVTLDDDFFALGGRSLQAIQAANRLAVALGREVPASALFRHPTVAALAGNLAALSGLEPYGHAAPPGAAGSAFAPLLTIQAGATQAEPALFCIHPAEGLAWCYLGLARHLPHTPIYGLQARGITGPAPRHIDALVDDYLAQIRDVQPHGPYRLLGWSSGGGVAHALALRLRALGEAVPLLAMMDAYPSDIWHGKAQARPRDALLALLDVVGAAALDAHGQPLDDAALLALLRAPGSSLASASAAELARLVDTALHTMRLYRDLRHEPFDGDLLFFHASERSAQAPDWRGWAPYVTGRITRIDIDSTHNTMSRPAPLAHIGRELAHALAIHPIKEIR